MEPDLKNNTEEKQKSSLVEILKFLIVASIVLFFVRTYIAKPFIVSGASMDPTFKTGEYLIVDEISYRFKNPERGEVIIFKFPLLPKNYYIKRIIGLPGETVDIKSGKVTIINEKNPDGFVVNEDYVSPQNIKEDSSEFTLGENEYFVMGDNRKESSDSRMWGAVDEDLIVGRPILRLLPPSKINIFPGR